MRLLHTHSLEIHFFPASIPAYAILSHTWEQDEVTFQEALCPDGPVKSKLGYEKLQKAADLAAQDGFEYIWIDTCCIDKTSSSELSEAINSMYRWYQKSSVCYAFLSDVQYCASSNTLVQPDIRNSKWFLRGWTLQELIAPSTLVFYSREWKEIGTKSSLRATISQITGIPEPVLLGEKIGNYSVAQRMSWASRRRTTRVEDIAYCLMGIFGITMPMLYGEGTRSFRRLQEEIMRQSDDQSIFAWRR
ncbi:HET-domain-containing protein, partial [Eremomyces bilateralis CBS 781.70]